MIQWIPNWTKAEENWQIEMTLNESLDELLACKALLSTNMPT